MKRGNLDTDTQGECQCEDSGRDQTDVFPR